MLPTVIAHRDIGNYFLQYGLPLHIFLVLCFRCQKIRTKFLFTRSTQRNKREAAICVYKLQSSLAGRISRLAQVEPWKLLLGGSSDERKEYHDQIVGDRSRGSEPIRSGRLSIVFASVIMEGYCSNESILTLAGGKTYMSGHRESPKYTLRLSMDAYQCSRVDTGLKNFKLLSRQLHSLLITHTTDVQILQRLYYKNKNQHRGSLFWRKVVEVRRYSERFEQHKPHILIDDFRCTFYGPGVHKYESNCYSSGAVFTLIMQHKFLERSLDPLSGCNLHFLYLEQD